MSHQWSNQQLLHPAAANTALIYGSTAADVSAICYPNISYNAPFVAAVCFTTSIWFLLLLRKTASSNNDKQLAWGRFFCLSQLDKRAEYTKLCTR